MSRILILTALKSELDAARAPDGVDVLYGGVGKINTAITTTEAILASKPALIVNYGTCGKITEGLRGLLEIARVIQRDMMAMPLAERGVTPLSDDAAILASGFGTAVCGTGDSFVTATDPWLIENNVDVVDMELFAIAHTCRRFAVPWRSFKFITDDANDVAHEHWTANVANGEDLFWDVLKRDVLGRS
jgi:adenosylhomocysteine nucleosidase